MLFESRHTRKPEILIICHSLSRNGANNHVFQLIHNLNDFFNFTILALSDGPMRRDFNNLNVQVEIWDGKNFNFSSFSLVIGNSLMTSRLLLKARESTSTALIIHEAWNPENLEMHIGNFEFSKKISPQEVRRAIQESPVVVLPARFQFDLYGNLFSSGQNVIHIPCTVAIEEMENFKKKCLKKDARLELGLSENEIIFLQVGTITMRKNQLGSVDMFHRFLINNPGIEARLILLGARRTRSNEFDYLEQVEKKIAMLGLREKVDIVDCQKNPYMHMRAADILLHPSFNEVMPLSIIEAAIFDLGVIASKLDGIPELLDDEINGMLIDPDNLEETVKTMENLAMHTTLNESLGFALHEKALKKHGKVAFRKRWYELLAACTA